MNHKLALEIPDTLNVKSLRIDDYSDYSKDIPIKCQTLEILCPGYLEPVTVTDLKPGFQFYANACNLGLQVYDCDKKQLPIPDGIYVIRYSVSPNDLVSVEYNYLRVSALMLAYKKALCSIPLCGTEPEDEVKDMLKELMEARMYIEAAKAKVEVCHEPKIGMELYEYAKKIIGKFNCLNC